MVAYKDQIERKYTVRLKGFLKVWAAGADVTASKSSSQAFIENGYVFYGFFCWSNLSPDYLDVTIRMP